MDTANLTPDEEGVYEVSLTVSDFLGPGTPKTVTITATTAQNFPIFLAAQIVADLLPSEVTTGGNQNAFQNFMTQAIIALQADDVTEAINKLEKAIARTDGCAERGSSDGNGKGRDWITSCPAQTAVYDNLNEALDALRPPVL